MRPTAGACSRVRRRLHASARSELREGEPRRPPLPPREASDGGRKFESAPHIREAPVIEAFPYQVRLLTFDRSGADHDTAARRKAAPLRLLTRTEVMSPGNPARLGPGAPRYARAGNRIRVPGGNPINPQPPLTYPDDGLTLPLLESLDQGIAFGASGERCEPSGTSPRYFLAACWARLGVLDRPRQLSLLVILAP